ncbi:MAG: hypothetical protein ACJATI_004670 [Halioglobus sp.]|jgi:hypothetical protein
MEYIIFEPIGAPPTTVENKVTEGALFVKIPRDKITKRSNKLEIKVYGNGLEIDKATTTFLGPTK